MPRRAPVVRLLLALVASLVAVAGVAAPVGADADAAGMTAPSRRKHSLRAPVTDEDFYFVMADRFENGTTANDTGGYGNDPLVSGLRPDEEGLLQRRRPQGPARASSTTSRAWAPTPSG